jgi:pimeloyl-ACP methyl ester carboxylesterase
MKTEEGVILKVPTRTASPHIRNVRRLARTTVILTLLFACACAAPIGVQRISLRESQGALTANILSTGELSQKARILLRRSNNEQLWEVDPAAVIDLIHATLARPMNEYDSETRAGYLDVVAELCFAEGARTDDPRYYLAAALYAWVYLFPPSGEHGPAALDRGNRFAADLYNRGITLGFTDPETGEVVLRGGEYALPFGTLLVDLDEESLDWGARRLGGFTSVADLRVQGLLNRYRVSGLGAPLAARTFGTAENPDEEDAIVDTVRVPVTAILRFDSMQAEVDGGGKLFEGSLFVVAYSAAEFVEIGGQSVPLEVEPSATLALQLAEDPPWKRELRGFFQGDLALAKGGLVALAPQQHGRIPLVLVHGTASSAGRWADMINDLWSDPVIRRNYQILLFSYNTGNPIAYSGWLLRKAIVELATSTDPESLDPALEDIVVMGHSQGGLLTKLLVVDSGDVLWNFVSDKPPDQLDLGPESREILEGSLLVEPLSIVKRVIFLSTPHRGSSLANRGLARLLGRFVRSPANIINASVELLGGDRDAAARRRIERGEGAIGNMSPDSEFIQTLAEFPIAPGVHAHSIMGVQREPKESGGDGVVSYESAHLDDVDSELVVRSGHSSQSNPVVVMEVRRILLEHLEELRARETLAQQPD